jgi:prophage tail gpP-like protein
MSVTLKVANKIYLRWLSVRITRGLKRVISDCELEIPGELVPAILPFQPCTVLDGADTLLTGYVVAVQANINARSTRSRVYIQSATQDLDCVLLGTFGTNQLNNYKLDAIARTVASKLGIGIVIDASVNVGNAFPDATLSSETAFAYLERLARQRAVLLTDDENGNLVLTTAGTSRAPAGLLMGEGGNVYEATGSLSGKDRFSVYRVMSQAGLQITGNDVLCNVEGMALDGGVPRPRPWACIAESALMPAGASLRARWEAAHRSGEAVNATLSVPGWRVGDSQNGPLWRPNQIVRCDVPRLALNNDFLIGEISYVYDGSGKRTVVSVAPPSAFTPEPVAALGTGNAAWAGIIPVGAGAASTRSVPAV